MTLTVIFPGCREKEEGKTERVCVFFLAVLCISRLSSFAIVIVGTFVTFHFDHATEHTCARQLRR